MLVASLHGLDGLRANGRIVWDCHRRGWLGDPDAIGSALSTDGFHEYEQELARGGRDRRVTGGLWEGLHDADGSVASAVWIRHPEQTDALVFVTLNGELVTDERG